jgi:hypothetical protein
MKGLINGRSDLLDRKAILDQLANELSEGDFVRVLFSAAFHRETWQRVDLLGVEAQKVYWNTVFPQSFRDVNDEAIEAVERLISAKRPRAAFQCVKYDFEHFDPELLFRLMNAIAKDSEEVKGQFELDRYRIDEAFERINQSTTLTIEQKASLEYLYIDALANPRIYGGKYGIPNLTKYIDDHPELYVQAIVYSYRRNDDGTDPAEYSVPNEQRELFARQGYKLISGIENVPGIDQSGNLSTGKLLLWIKAVRDACARLGRIEIADSKIGQLMAYALPGADGVWPCEPVRDALEELHSDDIMHGVHIGQLNARGVHTRGEGGAQERELADKYRGWAEALQYSHPYVASKLLMGLVKSYEHDARREDTDAMVQRRLR